MHTHSQLQPRAKWETILATLNNVLCLRIKDLHSNIFIKDKAPPCEQAVFWPQFSLCPVVFAFIRGRRFLVVKTNLHAKWKTCFRGVGQASACCCVTGANIDTHSCVMPGGRLYLNMGERSKAICGLLVNGRLVNREKSAQGEGRCNSCVGSSTQCTYSREWHGKGAQYLMVTVLSRLPLLCYHVGISTCWHLHTHWSWCKCIPFLWRTEYKYILFCFFHLHYICVSQNKKWKQHTTCVLYLTL